MKYMEGSRDLPLPSEKIRNLKIFKLKKNNNINAYLLIPIIIITIHLIKKMHGFVRLKNNLLGNSTLNILESRLKLFLITYIVH